MASDKFLTRHSSLLLIRCEPQRLGLFGCWTWHEMQLGVALIGGDVASPAAFE
jgi:hypothetical protein